MDTKQGKMLTYSERFPFFKPHNPLSHTILWSRDHYELTGQFEKNVHYQKTCGQYTWQFVNLWEDV